jgi:ribonuclease HI
MRRTDGSLNRKLSPEDQPVDSGAAAIIYFSEPDRDHEIVQYKITNAISSYEAEIVALLAGFNKIWDLEPMSKNIHVRTDSVSLLQQIANLPYKYSYVHYIAANIAEMLSDFVANGNSIEFRFVPSHTKKIPESDAIDKLAKQAAKDRDPKETAPFISSYRLHLKKYEMKKLQTYLENNVKASRISQIYPKRDPLVIGKFIIKSRTGDIRIPLDHGNALLNRARTGHTLTRAQMKRIGIEDSDKCRNCDNAEQTLEHQLIHCPKLARELAKYRAKYHQRFISDLNQALFDFNCDFYEKISRKIEKNWRLSLILSVCQLGIQ